MAIQGIAGSTALGANRMRENVDRDGTQEKWRQFYERYGFDQGQNPAAAGYEQDPRMARDAPALGLPDQTEVGAMTKDEIAALAMRIMQRAEEDGGGLHLSSLVDEIDRAQTLSRSRSCPPGEWQAGWVGPGPLHGSDNGYYRNDKNVHAIATRPDDVVSFGQVPYRPEGRAPVVRVLGTALLGMTATDVRMLMDMGVDLREPEDRALYLQEKKYYDVMLEREKQFRAKTT